MKQKSENKQFLRNMARWVYSTIFRNFILVNLVYFRKGEGIIIKMSKNETYIIKTLHLNENIVLIVLILVNPIH